MKTMILSIMLALQSFAYETFNVDSTQVQSPEYVIQCQQEARLYAQNINILRQKGLMNAELQKMNSLIQKNSGDFSLSCYYANSFNMKAKEILEKNR